MADDAERWIAGALAGALDDAARAGLADLVEGDASVRAELARQTCWDRWIRATRPERVDVDAIMRALPAPGDVATAVMRRTAGARRGAGRRATGRRAPMVVAALALAALIAVVASLIARPAPIPPRGDGAVVAAPDATRQDEPVVAADRPDAPRDGLAIVERVGPVQGDAASGFSIGADGRLALAAEDGTRIDVRGPAMLRVRASSADGLALVVDSGAVDVITVAAAPPRQGITLLTPTVELSTLVASRFHATVGAQASDVAVASGRVRFRSMLEDREMIAGDAATAPARITVTADQDGTADEGQPGGLAGDEPELAVRAEAPRRMACLRFRFPAQAIASAVLVLTRTRGEGAIDVHLTESTWDEATLRWWHVPRRGRAVGAVVVDDAGQARVDVTVACAGGSCDLSLWGSQGADCAFASREAAHGEPVLEISLPPMAPIGTP